MLRRITVTPKSYPPRWKAASTATPTRTSPGAADSSRVRSRAWVWRPETASARWRGTTIGTWNCITACPGPASCATPSTHGYSASRSPTSSRLLVTACCSSPSPSCRSAEVVSATMEGGLHRYTYADLARRSRQLASALARMGLETGDRVGTLAWNDYRHMELYYSVSGSGFVCHTINPRLFREQIAYIIEHAGDSVLFFDLTFLPVIEELADQLNGLKAVVAMTDTAHMPESDILAQKLPDLKCYETLIDGEQDSFDWPSFDENTASGLCYTSGTTGDPKGVLYSHRSSVLHAMAITAPDALGLSANDVVCPIVPMFHVNACGLPFAVPMVGAKLVLPGARLDGASLYALFEAEGVSSTAGVPTVWLGLLDWMDGHAKEFTSLKRVIIGGSAVPAIMISRFHHKGVEVRQAWGMTETSPLGDRKSTRLNSSHYCASRMPSSA